jgi:hypothetical protein
MIKKMGMKKSRRKFLNRLGVMAGAVLVPGLAAEDALAIPITTASASAKKKKAAVKKKAAAKKKKAAVKKKAAPKRKVAVKKKAAPKRKVAVKRRIHPYEYQPETEGGNPPRSVPEPSTVGLVSLGVAAIALATRQKKKGQERKD